MSLDPNDHTVDELTEALTDVDDPDELSDIRDAEADGKGRKTAIEAIDLVWALVIRTPRILSQVSEGSNGRRRYF